MTVRISDKLIGQVAENISIIYRKFVDDIEKEKPDVGDRLYEILYGPHLPAMNSLPSVFFRRMDRIETRHIGDKMLGLSFKLSSVKLGAYSHPSGEDIEASDHGDRINIKRTPVTEELVDNILEWRKRIEDVYAVREAGHKAVRGVFKAYASLPPVIKTFPPVVDLLPPEVRKKLDVPQHRLSSVAMELNPDLKRLAADIALHKFINR